MTDYTTLFRPLHTQLRQYLPRNQFVVGTMGREFSEWEKVDRLYKSGSPQYRVAILTVYRSLVRLSKESWRNGELEEQQTGALLGYLRADLEHYAWAFQNCFRNERPEMFMPALQVASISKPDEAEVGADFAMFHNVDGSPEAHSGVRVALFQAKIEHRPGILELTRVTGGTGLVGRQEIARGRFEQALKERVFQLPLPESPYLQLHALSTASCAMEEHLCRPTRGRSRSYYCLYRKPSNIEPWLPHCVDLEAILDHLTEGLENGDERRYALSLQKGASQGWRMLEILDRNLAMPTISLGNVYSLAIDLGKCAEKLNILLSSPSEEGVNVLASNLPGSYRVKDLSGPICRELCDLNLVGHW